MAILKLFIFLLILPLVIASFIAFQTQILSLPVHKEAWLLWGAGSYIAMNLFVYDFESVYVFGSTMVEKMLYFFKPSVYVIPVYSLLLTVVFIIVSALGQEPVWQPFFLFTIAFTLAMHVVLTAHVLYLSDDSLLKAHYLLSFGLVLIIVFFIISLFLAWAIPEFSLIGFVKSLASHTLHLYKFTYKMLFVDSSV